MSYESKEFNNWTTKISRNKAGFGMKIRCMAVSAEVILSFCNCQFRQLDDEN